MDQNSQIIHSWTSPEFIKKERGRAWFWIIGAAGLLFLIAALWMKNYVFAIIIPLFVFVIFSQAFKEPEEIELLISNEGMGHGENFTPFKEMKSFWVFREKDLPYVSIKMGKNLKPNLFIPIQNEDPEKIQEILIKFIPLEEQEESMMDNLAERLKI